MSTTMNQHATHLPTPPLDAGDHLSLAEFERRYQLHPEIKKAELVEGVVYMPSPVRFEHHGRPHSDLMTWLGVYRASTPGVLSADNTTVKLDRENEVQPDALLRLEAAFGGHSRITADDYVEGPPELIAEIAASSVAYDLHEKRRVYARTGVQEYLAIQIYEKRIDWLRLGEEGYRPLITDAQGILASEIFPGLRLLPAAFWASDLQTLLTVLQEGLASKEHAAFVANLRSLASQTQGT